MRRRSFRRKKRLGVVNESDNEPGEEPSPYTSQNLRLGIVQPGIYVEWASLSGSTTGFDHHSRGWSVPSENSEADCTDSDEEGTSLEEDMFIQMRQELEQEKMTAEMVVKGLKDKQSEWDATTFTLISPEGRHGDAELIRLLFAASGTAFRDYRVTKDEWEVMKQTVPQKTLPVLTKCGISWGVTEAIVRMLSKKFRLLGSTNDEHLIVDATYERLRRVQKQASKAISWIVDAEKNKEKFEWAQSQLLHVVLPPCVKEWEQQIRLSDGPFIVATGMTMADIAIMDFLQQCSSGVPLDPLLEEYLAVSDLLTFVKADSRIAFYHDQIEKTA